MHGLIRDTLRTLARLSVRPPQQRHEILPIRVLNLTVSPSRIDPRDAPPQLSRVVLWEVVAVDQVGDVGLVKVQKPMALLQHPEQGDVGHMLVWIPTSHVGVHAR